MEHMHHAAAAELATQYPPVFDTDVLHDEGARQSEFLVGAMAQVDEALLADGYPQLRVGQAHASRALDLIRLCDPNTARYLMVMNAKLWLDQAKAI